MKLVPSRKQIMRTFLTYSYFEEWWYMTMTMTCGSNFKSMIITLIILNSTFTTYCEIALRWMSQKTHSWKVNTGTGNGLVPSGNVDPDLCNYMVSLGHELNTVECRYNVLHMTWYCIHHFDDWGRIYIRVLTHERHPITHPSGRAMGCLLWRF